MKTEANISDRTLQYYTIARRWVSDIEFFKIETAFLHRLMDDYFIRLAEPEHIEKLRQTGKRLLKLEEDKSDADKLSTKYLTQLELMAENVIPQNMEELLGQYAELEKLMSDLTDEYREVKKELFSLVESVMKESKLLEKLYP